MTTYAPKTGPLCEGESRYRPLTARCPVDPSTNPTPTDDHAEEHAHG